MTSQATFTEDNPAILTENILCFLYIRMADHEWSSNTDMKKLAQDAINERPHTANLVVSVQEHAGWHEDYAMQDGELICVGTANDGAAITTERRKFWNRCGKMPTKVLPQINRK